MRVIRALARMRIEWVAAGDDRALGGAEGVERRLLLRTLEDIGRERLAVNRDVDARGDGMGHDLNARRVGTDSNDGEKRQGEC